MEKAYLLTENNIPLSYLDINYECNECEDTGYYLMERNAIV